MPGANVPINQYKNINKSNHGRNTTGRSTGGSTGRSTAKAKAVTPTKTSSVGLKKKVVLPKAKQSGAKKPSKAEIARSLKKAAILENLRSGFPREIGGKAVKLTSTPFSFSDRERLGATANSYTGTEAARHRNGADFAALKRALVMLPSGATENSYTGTEAARHRNATDFAAERKLPTILSSGTGGSLNRNADGYTDMEAVRHQNAIDLAPLRKASALLNSKAGGGSDTDTEAATFLHPEALFEALPESLQPGAVGALNHSVDSAGSGNGFSPNGILSTTEDDFLTPKEMVDDLKRKLEENENKNTETGTDTPHPLPLDPLGLIPEETKNEIEAEIKSEANSDERVAPYKYPGSTFTDEERDMIIDYAFRLSDEEAIDWAAGLIYEDGITSQSFDFIVNTLLNADEKTQTEMMMLILDSPGSNIFEPSDNAKEIFSLLPPEVQAKVVKATKEGLQQSGFQGQWMLSNAAKITEEKMEDIQEYRDSLSSFGKFLYDGKLNAENFINGIANHASSLVDFAQMLIDTHYVTNGYDPPDGFITNWINDRQFELKQETDALDLYSAATNNEMGANVARGFGNFLADLPFMFIGGGVGTAAKTASVAGTAAKEASTFSKIINFLKSPFRNAVTAERAAYYAGSRYDEAISNGATMGEAVSAALLYAFPQAYLEALGGADKITGFLLRSGIAPKKIFTSMATGAISEGLEEGLQQPWESGSKMFYGADIPLFSKEEGVDAWINPTMMKESALVGAILGGTFGSAATVDTNNSVYNFAKKVDTSSLNIMEDSIKNNLSAGVITQKTADQLLKETGAAKAVYDVVQTDSRVQAQGKIDGYVNDGTITKEQGDSLLKVVDTAAANNGVKLPTSTNGLARISRNGYNTNIDALVNEETQKLLDHFNSSSYGEALKFYVASGVDVTPKQAQQVFDAYLAKTGRADHGLAVNMVAAQGKNRDLPTVISTQDANASEIKTVVSSSGEALANLRELAKGKKVGDTVSAAYMENGQVKVYTASVNEFGINPVLVRNATVEEKAVLQGNDAGRRGVSQGQQVKTLNESKKSIKGDILETSEVGGNEGVTGDVGSKDKSRSKTKIDYKKVFFEQNPELKGKVVVHHGIEQQVLNRPETKGLFTVEEIHSYDNLRGIPNKINSDIHLSKIRKEWNKFYKENLNPTKEQLMEKRLEIDQKYGHQFNPLINK